MVSVTRTRRAALDREGLVDADVFRPVDHADADPKPDVTDDGLAVGAGADPGCPGEMHDTERVRRYDARRQVMSAGLRFAYPVESGPAFDVDPDIAERDGVPPRVRAEDHLRPVAVVDEIEQDALALTVSGGDRGLRERVGGRGDGAVLIGGIEPSAAYHGQRCGGSHG